MHINVFLACGNVYGKIIESMIWGMPCMTRKVNDNTGATGAHTYTQRKLPSTNNHPVEPLTKMCVCRRLVGKMHNNPCVCTLHIYPHLFQSGQAHQRNSFSGMHVQAATRSAVEAHSLRPVLWQISFIAESYGVEAQKQKSANTELQEAPAMRKAASKELHHTFWCRFGWPRRSLPEVNFG